MDPAQTAALEEATRALVQAQLRVLQTPDPLVNRRAPDPMAQWGRAAMETTTGGGNFAAPELNPIDPQPEGTGEGAIDHPFEIEVRTSANGVAQYRVLDFLSTVTEGLNGDSLSISGLANHLNPDSGWASIGAGGLIIIEGNVSDSLVVSALTVKKISTGDWGDKIELDANGVQTKIRAIIGSVSVDEDGAPEKKQGLMDALMISHGFLNGSIVVTFVHSEPHSIDFT